MSALKNTCMLVILCMALWACSNSNEPDYPEQEIIKGKITKELTSNGTVREYIIYIPQNYTGKTSYPLVLSFHGLTSNMEFNYDYTKFSDLAETEQFIAVHPNGINKKWNVANINNPDIDFIEALLSELEEDYNIESKRIYSTGMSNGGIFSFSLACNLSNKIASIASVTGTMLPIDSAFNNCNPTRAISVLEIHGTADPIIDYSTVERTLDFWNTHNNTDMNPIISDIPNIDLNDRSTVELFQYLNGDEGVKVEHLKIIGGGHDWPGFRGNMDISATEEVWSFMKKFDLNGKIE